MCDTLQWHITEKPRYSRYFAYVSTIECTRLIRGTTTEVFVRNYLGSWRYLGSLLCILMTYHARIVSQRETQKPLSDRKQNNLSRIHTHTHTCIHGNNYNVMCCILGKNNEIPLLRLSLITENRTSSHTCKLHHFKSYFFSLKNIYWKLFYRD